MNVIDTIFGHAKDLTVLQMTCRGIVVFIIALILLRISGRRSFGLHSPLDNIIVILLGAILSRAVVGASPFIPVSVCSLVIVLLHRGLAWLAIRNKTLDNLFHGNPFLLFEKGKVQSDALDRALLSSKDLEQALRSKTGTEDFEKIDRMYMEQNGEISVIKKP